MYKFEQSMFINRTPQEVFDFYTNPANNPKWQSGTESAEWVTDGPVGVGSAFRIVTNFLGRKIDAKIEITGWDPPNQFGAKTISGPIPFETGNSYKAQEGGTLMTSVVQAELGGFFKLAEGLVGKQMEKQFNSDWVTLKKLLEAG